MYVQPIQSTPSFWLVVGAVHEITGGEKTPHQLWSHFINSLFSLGGFHIVRRLFIFLCHYSGILYFSILKVRHVLIAILGVFFVFCFLDRLACFNANEHIRGLQTHLRIEHGSYISHWVSGRFAWSPFACLKHVTTNTHTTPHYTHTHKAWSVLSKHQSYTHNKAFIEEVW